MIFARAPLRISFLGGGTDLPDFYHRHKGRVVSTSIDKYVYVVVNSTPLIPTISARYTISETVLNPKYLKHTRIKAALLDLGINGGIEIASFASMPSKTGLGSSSSFSVALLKGLYAYLGKRLNALEVADLACRLELELINEPIGKQDQYAVSLGGFNIFEFNPDESVTVRPIRLNHMNRIAFEEHILVFFTGLTRSASDILRKQKSYINKNIKTLQDMSASVDQFVYYLNKEKFQKIGEIVHEGWIRKKSLSSDISNTVIDELYETGLENGAWGGKLLGAGGGGCLMFITPVRKKNKIRQAIKEIARKNNLYELCEIPIKFTRSGVEILHMTNRYNL